MTNTDIAQEISQYAISHFGDKLSSVLLYGSSVSARQIPHDLDIIIILKERESPEDLRFLAIKKEEYEIDIDLQVINLQDIDPVTFSHDTHGQFVIGFLKESIALYGENPFLGMYPTFTQKRISVIQKCQYYYFRAKKVQANISSVQTLGDISFHRKKLFLMLADFWYVYAGSVIVSPERKSLSEILFRLMGSVPEEKEIVFLLGETNEYTWDEIFVLYQNYYFNVIDRLGNVSLATSEYVGNIYSEQYTVGSDTLAIVASGLPSDYDESELASFLNMRGYDVVSFHYTATGKSSGAAFVSPSEDVLAVVEHYAPHYKKCILLGNSYGGYGILAAIEHRESIFDSIILVSPVYDFASVVGIKTLPVYLLESQSGWYRFPTSSFEHFITTSKAIELGAVKNITWIQSRQDTQIPFEGALDYCKLQGIDYVEVDNKHLSYNRLMREHVDVLHRFI